MINLKVQTANFKLANYSLNTNCLPSMKYIGAFQIILPSYEGGTLWLEALLRSTYGSTLGKCSVRPMNIKVVPFGFWNSKLPHLPTSGEGCNRP